MLHEDSVYNLPAQMRVGEEGKQALMILQPGQNIIMDSPALDLAVSRIDKRDDAGSGKGSGRDIQKYESPKFYVGSGSPSMNKHQARVIAPCESEVPPEEPGCLAATGEKSLREEVQHFSF